jgi:polyisoprenoid-binding protein YceI
MNKLNKKCCPTNASTFMSLMLTAVAAFVCGCSDPARDVHQSRATETIRVAPASLANARAYAIASESTIGFVGSKVTGSHAGGFREFSGVIHVAEGKVTGSSAIEIQMDSTWSDNERLTEHLKNADFFDVEQFPTAKFTVINVEPSGTGQEVTGNLELHGVSKSISFPADIQVANDLVTVRAEFAINRKDFGIVYPGRPDDLIRDNVVIKLDIKANAD